MTAIVFPISSAPGVTAQEGAGRIVNGYAIKQEQGARAPILWRRSAGFLERVSDITGHSHCRGFKLVGSTLLAVMTDRVYAVDAGFLATNLGALAGSDRITIARNNAGTPNIVAVCNAGTFNLFVGGAPTSFVDSDLPSVNACEGANGYIIFSTASGELWATDLNAVTVNSGSFVETELEGGLLRPIWYRDELFAMGPNGIKVYDETGASPFPFQYKKIHIPVGLVGTHAVAGNQNGWTGQLCWVATDNTVRQLDGYTPKVVSNADVSRAIESSADRSLIEADVYMDGPNPIFVITSPGEWTWELNLATGAWNERESYGRDDWRARCTVKAFDQWLAGDDSTGKVGKLDNTHRKELGDALVWELISGNNAAFPYRVNIGPAAFDFTAALGSAAGDDPIETDPVVLISWSLDGGYTWGNPVSRALGQQGEGGRLVHISSVGLTKVKGVRFKLQVSDPVQIGFQGGDMPSVQKRAA